MISKAKLRSLFFILTAVFLCTGFRVYNEQQPWDNVSNTSTLATKLFIIYDHETRVLENDLPGSDALYGTPTITVAQAMDSIFTDYNSIMGAYVTLADSTDTDYSAGNADRKTTYVYNRPTSGVQGGQADFESDSDGNVTSCAISLKDGMYDSAKLYVGVTTHEIAHCLGLDHPQEITKSIMSYFSDDSVYRLQADDKMALVYLYPTNPEAAKEDPTFGFTCSER